VRGYDEASLGPRIVDETGRERVLGGEFLVLTNLEARFPLPLLARWHFSGAVFFDAGNVWMSASDVSARDFDFSGSWEDRPPEDVRYGVGLGIRYHTPVGPIRVDYGYPLTPDVYTQRNGTWYFSLGQIF
jgi:outer membrane protein insertion porin family